MSKHFEFNSKEFYARLQRLAETNASARQVGASNSFGTQQVIDLAQNQQSVGDASQQKQESNKQLAMSRGQAAQKKAEKARAASAAATAFGGRANVDLTTQNLFNFSG